MFQDSQANEDKNSWNKKCNGTKRFEHALAL
jgi:hypothetical protein